MFELVKRYYDAGLYTAAQVYKFVEKGKLTIDQYHAIVGD